MSGNNDGRFQHRPLQNNSSVRLVTLQPAASGEPLNCHIAEAQSLENVSYEALSYAWGNDESGESVHICEASDEEQVFRTFPITRNLCEALQRLRSDAPRTLWIDALCINQKDSTEKGFQVARMGHVYRNASCVIVWLGEDEKYPRTKALLTQDGRNRWPLTLPEVDLGELMTISWYVRDILKMLPSIGR